MPCIEEIWIRLPPPVVWNDLKSLDSIMQEPSS